MSYIETSPLQHSTIIRIYSEQDSILMNPEYQRLGGVWTREKKQLLIDSILNDYDLPKIYLHEFSREEKKANNHSYAVIDGRQRLETIWQFIEGKFTLSEDFIYTHNEDIQLKNLSYSDIAQGYPKIKIKFDSFVLPIIKVETDDIELIEDMFSRLNEAVPLNAAEKRNAFGGELVSAIRNISEHVFFTKCVAFDNKRYRHLEIAARFLLIEDNLLNLGKILDTKKEYLDALAKNYKQDKTDIVRNIKQSVTSVLDFMSTLFVEKDNILKAQGNMVVYYLLCKSAIHNKEQFKISREKLLRFRDTVQMNRTQAEEKYADAKFELLEFDRLSQQGTNDASNIRERLKVIAEFFDITPII